MTKKNGRIYWRGTRAWADFRDFADVGGGQEARYTKANPVAAMFTKPTGQRAGAPYLDPHEAALLLESARTYHPPVAPVPQKHGGAVSAPQAFPHLYPLLATFLLTGG